jgi:hypothetical protein
VANDHFIKLGNEGERPRLVADGSDRFNNVVSLVAISRLLECEALDFERKLPIYGQLGSNGDRDSGVVTICHRLILGSPIRFSQHPDQYRPQGPILLAVDQEFGEGPRLGIPPELADPVGPVEVREDQDVEEFGASSGTEGIQAFP